MYPSPDPSLSAHHGNITQMDHAFGRLMQTVDELDLRDGVKATWPAGWLHVRASNTEPVLRLIMEAADRSALDRMFQRVAAQLALTPA